ncbi:MAG TPA: PQQ-binding-like beta-propeller repeat protein [Pyrinomonadaceae bacterium]|jgi:hypothetical protein
MNRRKLSAAVLSFALALVCAPAPAPCPAQEAPPAPTPKPSEVFRQARPVSGPASPDPVAFEFEVNGFSYHVRQNGNGRRVKGDRTRRFNLRLDDGGLGRVYFHDYGGRLLLVCEVGDGESGGGFVTLLEQPSMRARWKQTFPAPNVGEPLREGRHLYVTGAGFVGKLNLDTGEFDWTHEDLYDPREGAPKHFTSFETPELDGDAVLFRERPVYNPGKTLVVDRKSGKVIRVE